jgi:hypothetical protein
MNTTPEGHTRHFYCSFCCVIHFDYWTIAPTRIGGCDPCQGRLFLVRFTGGIVRLKRRTQPPANFYDPYGPYGGRAGEPSA